MSPGNRPRPSLASHGHASPTTRSAPPRMMRNRCIVHHLAPRRFGVRLLDTAVARGRLVPIAFVAADVLVARAFGFDRAAAALPRAIAVFGSTVLGVVGFVRRTFVGVRGLATGLPAFASSSSIASARVSESTLSLSGSVALTSRCLTYGPYRPACSSTGCLSFGCAPRRRTGVHVRR